LPSVDETPAGARRVARPSAQAEDPGATPDGCAWVVDYGAVRDPGGATRFVNPADAPLVQIRVLG